MLDTIIVETIARVCHEANKAYCITLGDRTQLGWEHAPEWQKESARQGVRFQLKKAQWEIKPSDSHNAWLEYKVKEGWIYGPVKDETKKEHPCLVPYENLPDTQKIKNMLFHNVVNSFRDYIPYNITF